jgi:hypothetical protein
MTFKLARPLPEQADLLSRFSYDPETGEVTRADGSKVGWDRGNGYLCARFDGSIYMLHRLIWKMVHGVDPECVDHLNGNARDNRLANLRSVSLSDNNRNQRLNCRNKSGHAGVAQSGPGRWHASISIAGKLEHLGNFPTYDEAVAARKKAEARNGYHQNHGMKRPKTIFNHAA